MIPNLTLAVVAGVLFATGVYLLLARSITRALLGIVLLSNGANVLLLVAAGPAGEAAFYGRTPESDMSDPLPQAMVLTAIVITLGMTAFILAMAHRSWQLSQTDIVADDVEDLRLVELAVRDVAPHDEERPDVDDDAAGDDRPPGPGTDAVVEP
ncbi:MAG: Na(+)/H(+) antiporter subunit C [Candidatus Nanopelagicales bacterium]|nr:Na(+)/H(+) antiporter subunit C [Candidatus Nanopelagicales bacterium]